MEDKGKRRAAQNEENFTFVLNEYLNPIFAYLKEIEGSIFDLECLYEYTNKVFTGETKTERQKMQVYNMSHKIIKEKLEKASQEISNKLVVLTCELADEKTFQQYEKVAEQSKKRQDENNNENIKGGTEK